MSYFPAPVTEVIGSSLPWTIALVGIATILAAVIGVALGAFVGWKPGTWLDSFVPATTLLAAVPYFWLALILVYLFATGLHLFPGPGRLRRRPGPGVQRPVPHVGTRVRRPARGDDRARVARRVAARDAEHDVSTLSEDYITTALAKGLPPGKVLRNYAARNAVLPSVAGFAISLGFIVSGSVVTEQVFSYPGIGSKLLSAVTNNDYALMQGIFLFITLAVLGANLVVDLLYGLIDPRTRAGARRKRS